MLDTGCSILDTGCSILDTGCSILDTGCWRNDTALGGGKLKAQSSKEKGDRIKDGCRK